MDLLDTRQLRAFQELAKRESFTEAAAHLCLTQSAVSHSIKALERTLEVSLFERLGKKVRLTSEGEALMPHVDAIISRMEKAIEDVAHHNHPGHGRIRIGAPPSISQYILPVVLREFLETFPLYDININSTDSQELIRKVENSELDYAIAMEIGTSQKLKFIPVFQDQIGMAIAPKHRLAKQKSITEKDIENEKFIVIGKDSDSYRIAHSLKTGKRASPKSSLEVGSNAAIKEMAKIGLGIGLLPFWVALDEIKNRSLVFHPLPTDVQKRNWGIYQREEPSLERKMDDFIFIEMCRRTFANLELRSQELSCAIG